MTLDLTKIAKFEIFLDDLNYSHFLNQFLISEKENFLYDNFRTFVFHPVLAICGDISAVSHQSEAFHHNLVDYAIFAFTFGIII